MTLDSNDQQQTQSIVLVQSGSRFSHYQIVSKIGAGGMGDVYLAQDKILDRNVVLKFLPAHLSVDKSFKARFLREARTAASLNHHNIITIYEIEESNERLYIAMEHVVGESLRKLLDRETPEPGQAIDILLQISQGLKTAHDNNIVHRDIKPDNIMIARGGLVKVLDFGLAKFQEDDNITRAGTTLGTVGYMSPEQGQGKELDLRSDIFSTGVVFYEMLTGRSAFHKENAAATIFAVVHDQLPALSDFVNGLPDEYQDILDRAAAKDPDQRYQVIDEMIDDINAIRGGSQLQPIIRTSVTPAPPKIKSLAILCLNNLGPTDDDYLCYGISEDLIVDLTRLGTMRVAPMRAVIKFRDSVADLAEIATKLDVDFILDGSLIKSGSTLRISAQLIEVDGQKNLWADRWELAAEELPNIKLALAQSIDQILGVDNEKTKHSRTKTAQIDNAAAYELYLRGRYAFDYKKDTSDVEVALGLFNQALAEEPKLLIAWTGIAQILVHKGENERAVSQIQSTLALVLTDEKQADVFRLKLVLAEAQINLSRWDEGRETLTQALTIAVVQGDLAGELEALRLLIDIHTRRAEFDQALLRFERVMEISRHLNDKDVAAEALKSIANVHLRRGEYYRARTLYEEAIVIARRRGNVLLDAKCICNIGLTHSSTGNLDEARSCYEKALKMYQQVGDKTGQANAYNNLALIHATRGSRRKAIEFGKKATEIQKALGDRASYALAICNVARYQATLGKHESAVASASEALKIAVELDYPYVVNLAHDSLGYCYFSNGGLPEALKYYKLALEVAQSAGLRRETALALCGLGEVYFHLKESEQCLQFSQQGADLAREIDSRGTLIRCSGYHAAAQVLEGDQQAGLIKLNDILDEARQYGDPRCIIMCLRLVAEMKRLVDQSDETKTESFKLLGEALKLAQESEIVYEIRLCTNAVDQL